MRVYELFQSSLVASFTDIANPLEGLFLPPAVGVRGASVRTPALSPVASGHRLPRPAPARPVAYAVRGNRPPSRAGSPREGPPRLPEHPRVRV